MEDTMRRRSQNDFKEAAIRMEAEAAVRTARKSRFLLAVLSLFAWPLAWWYAGGCGWGLLGLVAWAALALLLMVSFEWAMGLAALAGVIGLAFGWGAISRARRMVRDQMGHD